MYIYNLCSMDLNSEIKYSYLLSLILLSWSLDSKQVPLPLPFIVNYLLHVQATIYCPLKNLVIISQTLISIISYGSCMTSCALLLS